MDLSRYDRFTRQLIAWAQRTPHVIGLVALGSTADAGRGPDEWSDHDFWVITTEGHAEGVRNDGSWLPHAERIVVFFAETEHGRSAIYEDGHLIELAVFDEAELDVARANVYRVLYDTIDLAARMEEMARRTRSEAAAADPDGTIRMGKFLAQLVIGVNRCGRGEYLSANELVRGRAIRNLVSLITDFAEPERAADPDNLDPHRRFEHAFPRVASELDLSLRRPIPELADDLLDIAREQLAGTAAAPDREAVAAVRLVVNRVTGCPSPPDGVAR